MTNGLERPLCSGYDRPGLGHRGEDMSTIIITVGLILGCAVLVTVIWQWAIRRKPEERIGIPGMLFFLVAFLLITFSMLSNASIKIGEIEFNIDVTEEVAQVINAAQDQSAQAEALESALNETRASLLALIEMLSRRPPRDPDAAQALKVIKAGVVQQELVSSLISAGKFGDALALNENSVAARSGAIRSAAAIGDNAQVIRLFEGANDQSTLAALTPIVAFAYDQSGEHEDALRVINELGRKLNDPSLTEADRARLASRTSIEMFALRNRVDHKQLKPIDKQFIETVRPHR